MKLISWNVNGLRAAVAKDAFAWLPQQEPDILCLQETKCDCMTATINLTELGFGNVSAAAAEKAGYSGVATGAKDKILIKNEKTTFVDDNEGRILEHRFGDVALFNIYFPNGQKDEARLAYKMEFYAKFLAYARELLKNGKEIVICGDVNTAHREIDLANPKANAKTSGFLPIERAWIDELLAAGFTDTFRYVRGDAKGEYSWWSYRFNARAKNVGWRIDYFFVSNGLLPRLKDAFILQSVTGSDHCPVGIEIEI